MREAKKKEIRKIPVEIEFTEGYEQRFTAAVLKIYEKRKRAEMNSLEDKKQAVG